MRRASWNAMKPRIQCVQTLWNRGSSRSARRSAAEQPAWRTGVATDRAAGAAVRVQPARGVPDGGQHIRLEGQARPGQVLLMSGEYRA
jgi:hypothetical protein